MPKARLSLLCLTWLLVTASGPIRPGVEVGVDAGGGEYEDDFGCGARHRNRFASTHALVRYRADDSHLTLSAEASAFTSRTVMIEADPPSRKTDKVDVIGAERLGLTGRVGGQWTQLGFEAGAGVWGDRKYGMVLPTATLRVLPLPRHTFEFTAFDPPTHVHLGLFSLAYNYAGEQSTAALGLRPGQEIDLWGGVGYRVTDRNTLGVELHYFGNGRFGRKGAAFLTYRWHSKNPRAGVQEAM
jgi:hypothetical protein